MGLKWRTSSILPLLLYTLWSGACIAKSDAIFEKTFIEDNLINSTILAGKTLIVFGYGFSGSGKTLEVNSSACWKDGPLSDGAGFSYGSNKK